ncbi:MAG: TIM barrel protein [Bacteroidota bacterium]
MTNRRDFIKQTALGTGGLAIGGLGSGLTLSSCVTKPTMQFGLVTYMWGAEWDLPTLIANCEEAGLAAVELRAHHAHGVETSLSAAQREEVKMRFADSPVTCVGYGSNFEYHMADQAELRENIEQTKEYVKLVKDIGASGLKVKPNKLLPDMPRDKTLAQIATSLNEVGKFARDEGMVIRVEIHGHGTQELPVMKDIFEQVTESNVNMCWNCNPTDLNPPGLEGNFNMVKQWIGDVVHIHQLHLDDYPYQQLFNLLSGVDFKGWLLLEDGRIPEDIVGALKDQVPVFNEMVTKIPK